MEDKKQEKEILKFLSFFIRYWKLKNITGKQILKNMEQYYKNLTETERQKEIIKTCNNTIKQDNLFYPLIKV